MAAFTAAAAVVVWPSPRRVLKALHVLPLQALYLAHETGPFATYDAPAWASGRPSRVVFSSAADLIRRGGAGGVLTCPGGVAMVHGEGTWRLKNAG
jgi:hypothetical protein